MARNQQTSGLQYDLQAAAPHLTNQWRRTYRQRLTEWFNQHQRDLPWRKTSDPYAIWISESMLQQTQVATVIAYYERFLERFPTVESLAAAEEQVVLGLWAGLGYYRRARQLHAAAKKIVNDHAGEFPDTVPGLSSLPGIGRYTAGAICSIAFDKPAPIVEANTQRVYARLMKVAQPESDLLWEFAQWQLPNSGSRIINQAAMELGSLVCKPNDPLCQVCPLVKLCPTAAAGLQHAIPAPKPQKQFTDLHHLCLIVERERRWLVRQNPESGWWHGLWDFPRVDITELNIERPAKKSTSIRCSSSQLESIGELANRELFGERWRAAQPVVRRISQPSFAISHGVTRYRIRLDCATAMVSLGEELSAPDWQWADLDKLASLPLTSTAKRLMKIVTQV